VLIEASLEEAQMQILNHTAHLSDELISILEAVGRISAIDLYADNDLPAQAQSAVDGYAVAGESVNDSGRYYIAGRLCLGDNPQVVLRPGEAMGVLTGGNLPVGTIAVIPHEKVQIQNNYLRSLELIKAGNNIKKAGEDYIQGDRLISRGSLLGPGDISLLAAYGRTNVSVYRKPRVAVFCLSRNVVPWQLNPEPGQTRDSNGPLLSAMIIQDGGLPVSVKIVGEDKTSVKSIALNMLEEADMLIITGGTYADGCNDARTLMEDLGADLIYWDLPIQPGSHTGAAVWKSRLIFALSGNPAACAVGYKLFVEPAISTMQGLTSPWQRLKARCTNGFPKKSGSRRFIRGHASWDEEGWKVTVLSGQKPSMIRSLVQCNALIDMPAKSPPVESGQDVSILLLKSSL
jgi:molybdopterin molybdotransferase